MQGEGSSWSFVTRRALGQAVPSAEAAVKGCAQRDAFTPFLPPKPVGLQCSLGEIGKVKIRGWGFFWVLLISLHLEAARKIG